MLFPQRSYDRISSCRREREPNEIDGFEYLSKNFEVAARLLHLRAAVKFNK